jgi:hypothetical protein
MGPDAVRSAHSRLDVSVATTVLNMTVLSKNALLSDTSRCCGLYDHAPPVAYYLFPSVCVVGNMRLEAPTPAYSPNLVLHADGTAAGYWR